MRPKLMKELRARICSKEQWQPDGECLSCQCCGKLFTFFRRRHHCRLCGKIYCFQCSNFYLNGLYLQQTEKYVRHCEFCREVIEKIKRECKKTSYNCENSESNGSEDSENSSDVLDNEFNLQRLISTELAPGGGDIFSSNLESEMKKISLCFVALLETAFMLSSELVRSGKLLEVASKLVAETKMQILPQSIEDNAHYMDILKQVRIEMVNGDPLSTLKIVQGLILDKASACKKMLTFTAHPRVIVVENSIDLDALPTMGFEDLVSASKLQFTRLMDKVIKLSPDVIFVEKTVSFQALERFHHHRIAIFSKIKRKDLNDIVRLLGIKKTVKSIAVIEKYKPHNIIGDCDSIYINQYQHPKSVLFIEKQGEMRSLLLGELTQSKQQSLRKAVQILLRLLNQLRLEKQLILAEQQMNRMNSLGNQVVTSHYNFYNSIEGYLQSQNLSFVRFLLSEITPLQGSDSQNYLKYMRKTQMYEICGQFRRKHKKIYSEEDITIGAFLLIKAPKKLGSCEECSHVHAEALYFPTHMATIQLVATGTGDQEISQIRQHNITGHFQCADCPQIFSSHRLTLGKSYLRNSFYYLLSRLGSTLQSVKQKGEPCSHRNKIRVFTTSKVQVRIRAMRCEIYRFDVVDLRQAESELKAEASKMKYLRESIHEEMLTQSEIVKILMDSCGKIVRKITLSGSNSELSRINEVSDRIRRIHLCLEEVSREIPKLESQHKLEDEITKCEDWTIPLYRIQQQAWVLKCLAEVLGKMYSHSFREDEKQQPIPESFTQVTIGAEEATNGLTIISEEGGSIKREMLYPDHEVLQEKAVLKFIQKMSMQRFISRGEKQTIMNYPTAYSKDPVSLLACGLNSQQFLEYHEQAVHVECFTFKCRFHKQIQTSWSLKTEVDQIYGQFFDMGSEKSTGYQISAYYHREFDELRKMDNISFEKYINSLCSCKQWKNQGGKSQSTFAKSHDQLLVVKVIKEKEFAQFNKFARQYLKYVKSARHDGQECLLTKIYGFYELTMGVKTKYCIVMQNLFFGLINPIKIYDLKGSELNRIVAPASRKQFTGMDTNFKIDRDCHPFIVEASDYRRFISNLENDTLFLKNQAVIDYSLLLIEDYGKILRVSIIDFMRPYHFIEKIENLLKEIRNGQEPTVVPPEAYAARFLTALKRYFLIVDA